VNLLTAGVYQFAAWYDLAGELHIGRVTRGVHQWGRDHQEYTFAGAPRTALGLPNDGTDQHDYPAIAVDGLGRLHLWANMHLAATLRAVVSTAAHTTDGWLATAGWTSAAADFPGMQGSITYPTPITLADGRLWFYIRTGPAGSQSGRGDSYFWTRAAAGTSWAGPTTIFQGLSVPDAGGPGVPGSGPSVDDLTNWNAYPTNPVVESERSPHPGRLHMSWIWRGLGADEDSNTLPSYGYSDDGGATWSAIDGTALTLPVTPLNSIAARFPGSAFVQSIQRESSLVFAALDTPNHGLEVGNQIRYQGKASFNGIFTVAVVNGSLLVWVQAGANDPAGGTGTLDLGDGYTNWGGLAVDDDGLPHVVASSNPVVYVRRNAANDAWVQSTIPNPLNGIIHLGLATNPPWLAGGLWMLKQSDPGHARRCRLYQITGGTGNVVLSGAVGGSGSAFEPSMDPEAYRRFGTVEVLAPDGDSPRVFTFGNGARAVAAA